jgi:hypothetical protein
MRWLRSIARRPAVKESWSHSRIPRFADRITSLIEEAV